jgi:small subunit ribosomal protein S2
MVNTKASNKPEKKKVNKISNLPYTNLSTLVKVGRGSNGSNSFSKKAVKVGNNYTLKITALSSSNVGLNEYTFGFPVLIGGLQEAKATLGDFVQVKILKIKKAKNYRLRLSDEAKTNKSQAPKGAWPTYAVAKIVKVSKGASQKVNKTGLDLLGKTFEVTVLKKGPKGSYLAHSYLSATNTKTKFFVFGNPLEADQKAITVGQKVMVKVIRLKKNYVFAKLVTSAPLGSKVSTSQDPKGSWLTLTNKGSRFTLVLPKKAKRYLKHIIIKLSGNIKGLKTATSAPSILNQFKKVPTILFIKPLAGVKLGDKVQIQIVKGFQTKNTNILIGKIFDINPISATNKKAIVKTTVKQMLNSGMHYGEKAIKCNARMLKQNYVWMGLNRRKADKKGKTDSKGLTVFSIAGQNKPLIKKGRNIINLLKTRRCLNKALSQLSKYAAKGKTFLFVGTKKAASGLIARASLFSKKAFFVNTRWLGGMLTNWKTIVKSISKIRPILKEKQLIIKDILQKRQSIKTLLMEKAFLLKKKSNFVLKKGRQLLQKYSSPLGVNSAILEKTQKLTSKRKELVQKGQVLLEKRQLLLQKRKQVIAQSQVLYANFVGLTNNSKEFLSRATLLRKKLRELKALLFVGQQLQQLQQNAKKQNNDVYTLSYNASLAYKRNQQEARQDNMVLPNPPKEILNKMVLFIRQNAETTNISKKEASNTEKASSSKVYVLTQLLSQFSSFAPAIKTSIKLLLANLKKMQAKLSLLKATLKGVVEKMENYYRLKEQILLQLRQIQQTFVAQRNVIRVVKRKLKQISAQKRLIQFLPKLRYLPTPSTKISLTVQVLMKKIVDPKLKYPIDFIYDQKLIADKSKKVASMRKKKWQRLEKYLGGISNMTQISSGQVSMSNKQIGNNNLIAVIVGQQEEMNAVRECKKLGIKMFHIVDTNCNPGLADHFIPANDDSRNSIQYILTQFLTRIRLAQKLKKA